jgi:cytochrome c-type protein NapB
MKKLVILLLAVAASSLFMTVSAVESVPLKSLRGDVPLTEEPKAPEMKNDQKDHPVELRSYVQQPPLIPHTIRDYRITTQHNKCMECHSWTRYREFGATKISMTHFKDRSGTDTDTVSPLRYFCTQCHAPQTDAAPLVENTFKPIKAIQQVK